MTDPIGGPLPRPTAAPLTAPQVDGSSRAAGPRTPTSTDPASFARTFEAALTATTSAATPTAPSTAVRFSRHAEERIRARGIQITPTELERLGQAIDDAAARGAKDSLVLSPGLAFVVNVPSRTVVTALGSDQTRGHVFTNIDSAVVL